MNIRLFRFLIALLACLLTACPETKVGQDFGFRQARLRSDDWNGLWRSAKDDELMRMQVIKDQPGHLRITSPKEELEKKDKAEVMLLGLRTADEDDKDMFFAMMTDAKHAKDDTPLYLLRREDNHLMLWEVNQDEIEEGLRKGTLRGTLQEEERGGARCRLESHPDNYRALANPRFWEWKKPHVLIPATVSGEPGL